jgi:tRNA U34 5-carboxymethylaminomethyl modifying GTPase MnmE/TrmE
VYESVVWAGRRFLLVDTGGFIPESADQIDSAIRIQVKLAVEEANLVIFMVDASEPMTSLDREVAGMIRQSNKEYLIVANKCDNDNREMLGLELPNSVWVRSFRYLLSMVGILAICLTKFKQRYPPELPTMKSRQIICGWRSSACPMPESPRS